MTALPWAICCGNHGLHRAGKRDGNGQRDAGPSDRTKIQLRAAGFRLVVEVCDHAKALGLVMAVGKRERNAGYRQAVQR